MPLVRVEVRNEYGLGLPELYKEANREDPKSLLDGVAVAGLVGILRQLGDLAEFAAEVFHGLQEQVMVTSSRSHKLMVRVQNIEAALPPLEKAILAQRSHLHFAYTAGSRWHARVRSEQNHFIYSDLPRFIMDSYDQCHGPPRLQLLDKFDAGGPGSCLKRYSDPTFFKRASAGLDEANVEKVPRVKKARRSKKKRTCLRNGEVSHGAPISSHSGRMQFASPNFDGQTSPSVSTFDVALKSEPGNQSNSFDARTGSGYIECVLHPSYATECEEYEPKEFSSSRLNMHHNDTFDSASLDGQSRVVDDDLRNTSSHQTGPSLSCVTWDEKTEIMEPTGQQYGRDETTEMLRTNFDLDTREGETMEMLRTNFDLDNLEGGAVHFRTVDQIDFHFDNENMLTSVSGGNQVEDIESETDNYVDALNTIESETETDLDCQTKQEVEQYSTLNCKAVENGMHRLTAQHSDGDPLNFDSHVPAYISSNETISRHNPNLVSLEPLMEAYSSSNNGISRDRPNAVSQEYYADVQSPEMAGESLIPGTLLDGNLCGTADILNGSNVEIIVSNVSSPGTRELNPQDPMSDKIISSTCESQTSPSAPSSIQSIMFWTNGSLLGLEPSKPPDFGVLNAVSQDSVAKSNDDKIEHSSQSNILEVDGHGEKSDIVVKSSKFIEQDPSSKCSTSCHNNQEDCLSLKNTSRRFSPADLDVKLKQSGNFHHSNSFSHVQRHGSNETSTMTPGTPISPDVQATKPNKEDGKNLSHMFEFSNRLLVNGFRRQVSLRDDNPSTSMRSGISEQKSTHQAYQTFSGRTFKEQFGSGSPIMSPSSSPPLEHMKISFQPIDAFETSKLKLKFPDGNNCLESSVDMFPSFQLVPEPAISLQDIDSDSDDGTFCRSSPYMSDDCLSNHSESNSEQWESDESPRSKDHELYDALFRISSTESVSSYLVTGGLAQGGILDNCGIQSSFTKDDVEPFQSGRLLDLPSFDTLNSSCNQELVNHSDEKYLLESHFPKEPTPPPPPLPPLQWRAPDVTTEQQDALSEALTYAFDPSLSASTVSQQPKPAPVKQDQNTDAIANAPKSKQPDCQKQNGQKEANQTVNGEGSDEKDDFLNQIRTKSFSLRCTGTERPTFMPGAPTNVKVTAILEKANAIRQAVGSDDGEDDNWSDT